ncbi:hypothetical protein L5515_003507 [Caenorhabditis briggsae]|uniref:DNA-directed DNA polymerase n=1 Tax=Caenorhabditis briggsae TaxID=6238 RepID=A0AAE9EF13_CAEBR|nr:hypothetical protein L5515_003507 [Caenorhabditis briggsae]
MEKATCRFPNWVSTKIVDFYAEQGINYLFDWQLDVLTEANESTNQHLIFSAPTSAGKSIVAELLAWKVASTGKKVLFVLPYISVAREKLHQIQRCWRRDDIAVCGFIGPQASNPNEWIGAVCTIEKAASLTNRALSEEWFNEIGMIVVDEMHMVFDSSRGAHIEHMLSKVLLWNSMNSEEKIQIIGMSATIPELNRLGEWLESGKVCEANFRPISLNNHIIIGSEMKKIGSEESVREFSEDPLITLAKKSFLENQQTLIMISSKLEAEKTALNIANHFHELKLLDDSMMERLRERADGLLFIKNGLERHGCKDRNVMAALAWGVAFHHAGLTMEERECIEMGFREKSIIILVATSTLASGVNLPAERVIIKAQTRGPSALTSLSYRQMVGRAGRTGHATRGESFLIVKKCDETAVHKILNTPIDQLIKVRNRETDRTTLSRFVLEGICTGLTTSRTQIHQLCSLLLFNSNTTSESDNSIEMLLQNSFISLEDDLFSPTQLGRAAIASSLPPEASLAIFEDLNSASRAIAVDTELHMLYLVTPINVTVWQECDWHHLFSLFSKLPSDHRRVAKMVGASEKFILEQLQGKRNQKALQVHIRFFSALALFDLINEMSIYQVSNKYRIPRGCLQTLQSQSATYAAMIVAFCLRLGWTYLKALLDGFAMRLLFGIRSDLSELVTIEGIDGQRARILHERGITCLSHLSACESSKLAHFITLAVPYSRSNSNDGLGEWLFGEPRMKLADAARVLKERARKALMRRIQELGIAVELPKEEGVKKEENIPESYDSGLPDSCPENDGFEEMTRSVTEMSISDDDYFKEEKLEVEEKGGDVFEEEVVEDTMIEDLETSLLKMKPPKDEIFLRRLSNTFSPAGKRCSLNGSSFLEDSFDKPVPGSIPLTFKTPKRDLEGPKTSTPQFEDSFDKPVPGSIPLGSSKRKSLLNSSRRDSIESNASENKSFDVFATPPTRNSKIIGKHSRAMDLAESPLCSPIVKHPKIAPLLRVEDIFSSQNSWSRWMKSSVKSSFCSISLAGSEGIVIQTDTGIAFIPLQEQFNGIESPNPKFFDPLSTCHVPLKSRLDCLKIFFESQHVVHVLTMNNAFRLFEEYKIKLSNVRVLRVAAHLNHLIESEIEDNGEMFPMLLDRIPPLLDPEIQYSTFGRIHKSMVEVFEMQRIFNELKKSAIKRFTSEKSFDLEMDTCQAVLKMFYSGISFDHVACKQFIGDTRKRIEILEEQIWRLAHGKFNINSSNEASNVLFHRLGLVYPETSSCKIKQRHLPTNKQILDQMIGQHQIVEKILTYRHIQHTLTQCLLPLANYEERIHCRMEMCTATGRMLTSSPNLQNVPKKVSSDGLSARQLFKASPGNILIGADYKQLELRVLAHLCNDSKLVKIISEDQDLFGQLSSEWGFSRDVVKQLSYGLIYGMGAKTLAELTRIKLEEAEKMLVSFFAMFPGVRSYINAVKDKIAKEEPIETIMGRKKFIKLKVTGEEKARMERVAVNYTVQGSASEIFKTAMVEIQEKIRAHNEVEIVLTIHDEVLVECPEHQKSEISTVIQDCMQSALSNLLRVPMKISLKTGRSWADLK